MNFLLKYKDRNKMEGKVDTGVYSLPTEMTNIITATIAETSQGDVILCHDNDFLYAARVVRGGGNVTFQKFSLPMVKSLRPIIKNYFMTILESQRLVVFEVGFNEENKIMLKFIFNKEKAFASLFLREVAENMAELHICFPDNEIVVHQFTVNGKVGVMNYMVGAQNKLTKCERQQLYGSKSMCFLKKKCIYYFTNFSNRFVSNLNLTKFENDIAAQYGAFPLAYVSKQEEFYVLLSNFHVVNVMNPTIHHRVYCEERHVEIVQRLADPREAERYRANDNGGLIISTHFDMILIEDAQRGLSYIFQIKPKGSNLIGLEYGNFNWFWTSSRKIVGIAHNRISFKIVDEIKLNDSVMHDNLLRPALNRKDYKYNDGQKSSETNQQKINFKNIIKEEPKYRQKDSPQKITHSCTNLNKEEGSKDANLSPTQRSQENILKLPQKYKPMKIIQKSKVSVSKTIHKSKEIEPISHLQDNNIKKQQAQVVIPSVPVEDVIKDKIKEQDKENAENAAQQLIQQQCQKMASALLDQPDNEKKQAQAQPQRQEEEADRASCEQVGQMKEGDIYPKQESDLSDSLVLPDKKEDNNDGEEAPPNEQSKQVKVDAQDEIKQPQSSLPKSLAVLIGKSNLGGEYSHPLNLFSTSINRNNIFSSLFNKHQQVAKDPAELRRHRSEQDYYNPFTAASPCLAPKKEEKTEEEPEQQKEKEEEKVIQQVKKLFEQTTTCLLKVVEELANLKSNQPYLRDKSIEEIKRCVREGLQKMMLNQFTSRMQRFFYQIFRQTDQVQQESIKFYKEANSHKANNIEVQLNNQEKLIKQIRDIEGNLRFCISHIKDSNRATFQNFLRDWQQQANETRKLVDSINAAKLKIEAEQEAKAKRYEQTKQNLQAIKILLTERINSQTEKKQRKIEREKQKELQRQLKGKKAERGEKERSKKRKAGKK